MAGEVGDQRGGGAADVVGDAGFEADLDQPVKRRRFQSPERGAAGHWIGEGAHQQALPCGGQVGIDGVDIAGEAAFQAQSEKVAGTLNHPRTPGITQPVFQGNLDAKGHGDA